MKIYNSQLAYPIIKIGPYTTSKFEIRDLIKSWIALSIAYSIATVGLKWDFNFLTTLMFSAITVGIAFIFHELGHKITAQHYGCFAEFRSQDTMLFLGIIMSFTGMLFFAPGAVLISGPVGKRRNGVISASGPGTNFGLAILFLIGLLYVSNPFLVTLFSFGHIINTWIGLFNMIPFWLFDGKKILNWSKVVYFGMVVLGILLLLAPNFLKGIIL